MINDRVDAKVRMDMGLKVLPKKELNSWSDAFNEWYKTSDEYLGDISIFKIKKEK